MQRAELCFAPPYPAMAGCPLRYHLHPVTVNVLYPKIGQFAYPQACRINSHQYRLYELNSNDNYN
jgi:hypothetical protein